MDPKIEQIKPVEPPFLGPYPSLPSRDPKKLPQTPQEKPSTVPSSVVGSLGVSPTTSVILLGITSFFFGGG